MQHYSPIEFTGKTSIPPEFLLELIYTKFDRNGKYIFNIIQFFKKNSKKVFP